MNFILLLAVFGGLAFKLTSPADRARYLGVATDFLRQLKVAAQQPRPEYESFRDALRARTRDLFVTPALLTLNAAVFTAMLFGSGAIGDPDTLLGMGASIGTRTTNGEWWRLLTSAFVHIGMFHLIVNLAVLAQVGAVLERLVGRLAFGAVYIAAGVFTALVNVSSHPVEVTVGATGAIFGLYGLLLASVIWQTLNQMRPLLAQITGRLRRRAGNAEAGADESGDPDMPSGDPGLLIPPIALKRLGYGAGLFILLSAMSGLATSAEFTGLIVGLGYGLVVARRAGYESPAPRPVGAVLGVAVALAVACAIPLRNIANVRPEITRVVATEERTAATYQAASDAFRERTHLRGGAGPARRAENPARAAVGRGPPDGAQECAVRAPASRHRRSRIPAPALKGMAPQGRRDSKGQHGPARGVGAIHGRKLAPSGTGSVQIEPGGDGECGRRRAGVARSVSARQGRHAAPRTGARRGTLKHLRHPPYLRRCEAVIAASKSADGFWKCTGARSGGRPGSAAVT